MSRWWFLLFIYNFLGTKEVIFSVLSYCSHRDCQDFSLEAQGCKEKESAGTPQVAFAPSWATHLDSRPIELTCNYTFIPSQQRSFTTTPHSCRNGESAAGQRWMDVWQLQETPHKECVVLRFVRFCMGRLHSISKTEEAAIEIIFEEDILDCSGTSTSGRSSWRKEPQAAAKEESRQRQGKEQRRQRTSADTVGSPSAAANWHTRTAASLDEYASATRCFNIVCIHNLVSGGTEIEGGLNIVEEGQPRISHSGASAICCGRDQGCNQKGCKDVVHRCGYIDKSQRRAGHSPPCQKQPDDAMEILSDNVTGEISTVHRPLSESGAGASGEHQKCQGKASQSKRGLQHEGGGCHSDLRRRERDKGCIHKGIGHEDSGETCAHDSKLAKTFRTGRTRAGRRGKKGQEAETKGRRAPRCGDALRRLAINAAFWCARSLMTLEYFDRWAAWPPSIAADVAGLQWSHSILQEPFYKSPWQASEDAMHLAFTMQPNSFIQQCERREWGFSVPHRKIKKGLTVSFDPIAHVHFGPESSSSWTTSRVSIDDVSHREWLPKSRAFSQSNCNVVEAHTSSQQLLTLSRTAPISHRPDPTENPNLPDPPSSSEESTAHGGHGRIPIRHLPAWVETLWNILQDEGATELLEEGPIIYLSTYYLSHRTCIRQAADRPIRLTRRYEEWIEEFKSVWGDLFDREADFNVYLVQPEPPISLTRGIVGIVLIVQHAQPGGHAILTTALFDELPTPRTAEIAHVVDTWTDYSTVLHRAEAFEACREAERQGFPPCVL